MLLFKKVASLQRYLSAQQGAKHKIGFAPTMGALHEGHLSLIRESLQKTDCTVCSIFVNPTQFNDPEDLVKYPRTPEKDMELLVAAGCQVLFMPDVEEIYPTAPLPTPKFDFRGLDKRMEGAFRPGHFAGVAQVVWRLLDIVRPDRLFMGQKDFQQSAIVQDMLNQLHATIQLVVCPTMREADGLAMSSRNGRLSEEQRSLAPLIYKSLREAKEKMPNYSPEQITSEALQQLTVPGIKPEYFEIVDAYTLEPVRTFEESDYIVACVAVWMGEVRLIDNFVFKKN